MANGQAQVSADNLFAEQLPGWLVGRGHKPGINDQRWLFDRFPGRWEVRQKAENSRAIAFWRRVIDRYTGGRFEEEVLADERWHGPVQRFDNSRAPRGG